MKFYCSAGINYCYINYNGEIFKCVAHSAFGHKFLIGKIQDTKSIYKISQGLISSLCEKYCCSPICDQFHTEQWKEEEKIISGKWTGWEGSNNIHECIENTRHNFHIHAELASGCINKCPYCNVFKIGNYKFKYIDSKYWIQFLAIIKQLKLKTKIFSIAGGGEPLGHPEFHDIINYATDNEFRTNFTTSALNFHSKFKKLKNLNKLNITISLHPLSPLWNKEKIENIISYLKENHIMHISCNLVTHPKNMEYYDEFKEMLDKYDIYLRKFDYDPNH